MPIDVTEEDLQRLRSGEFDAERDTQILAQLVEIELEIERQEEEMAQERVEEIQEAPDRNTVIMPWASVRPGQTVAVAPGPGGRVIKLDPDQTRNQLIGHEEGSSFGVTTQGRIVRISDDQQVWAG